MSGSNPFRRSKILAASESLPSIPDSSDAPPPNLNNVGVFDPNPNPHSKSVRIQTPPVPSPAQAESRSYFPAAPTTTTTTTTRTLHSPPPLGTGDSDDSSDESASDPFNSHASAVDTSNNINDERGGSEPRYQRTKSQNNDAPAVNNPDSRLSVAAESQGHGVEGTGTESSGKSNDATLDVDAFTRLLLTGNADQLSDPKKTATARIDTASDLSTPSQVDNVDTENPVASASQRIHSDNSSNNIGTAVQTLKADENIQRTASVKRPKPPPPKTRHGKPIKADESLQSRKSSAEGLPSGESSQKPIYPTTSISPPSDYREEMAAALEANPSSNSSDSGITDDVSSLHRTSSQSKRPPTPPLARRHSQIVKPNKTPQPPPRPRDNINRISMPPRGLGLHIPGPPSPGFKTPPRPPSRRRGELLAGSQADSSSQPKSSLSQDHSAPSPNVAAEDASSAESSSPPSRQPSIKRTPSGSAANMPPPPPPPRRARASSKGSLNNPAAASLQTKTPDDQAESESQPSSHAKDILADLSRLQQEVDSLRGQYANRKASQ